MLYTSDTVETASLANSQIILIAVGNTEQFQAQFKRCIKLKKCTPLKASTLLNITLNSTLLITTLNSTVLIITKTVQY